MFVRKLAEILEETSLGEIELADGDRASASPGQLTVAQRRSRAAAPMPAAAPAAAPVAAPAAAGDLGKHPGAVKSPMVGTAYLAPEPGKPGLRRTSATRSRRARRCCIIEAMKTFNPIKAPKAGTSRRSWSRTRGPWNSAKPLMIVE